MGSIFLSGLPWSGTVRNPAPDTIDHTVGGRERERGRERGGKEGKRQREREGEGGRDEEARCLSLPWSPMALLTIQHPPNYPPIHSQERQKPRSWSAGATWPLICLTVNITPTSLSLEVTCVSTKSSTKHHCICICGSTTNYFTEAFQKPFYPHIRG